MVGWIAFQAANCLCHLDKLGANFSHLFPVNWQPRVNRTSCLSALIFWRGLRLLETFCTLANVCETNPNILLRPQISSPSVRFAFLHILTCLEPTSTLWELSVPLSRLINTTFTCANWSQGTTRQAIDSILQMGWGSCDLTATEAN